VIGIGAGDIVIARHAADGRVSIVSTREFAAARSAASAAGSESLASGQSLPLKAPGSDIEAHTNAPGGDHFPPGALV
jgi:hypothetical protein